MHDLYSLEEKKRQMNEGESQVQCNRQANIQYLPLTHIFWEDHSPNSLFAPRKPSGQPTDLPHGELVHRLGVSRGAEEMAGR